MQLPPRAIRLAAVLLIGAASAARSQQGLWLSDGYGYFFEVSGDTLHAFEITSVSCIPSVTAASVPAPAGALAAFRFTGAPVTVLMLADSVGGGMRYHM